MADALPHPGRSGATITDVDGNTLADFCLDDTSSTIAPFHNVMLVSPATTARQVDRLVSAFGDIAARLTA